MTDGDTWMDTKHGDRLIRPPMSIPLTDLELMFYGFRRSQDVPSKIVI